MAFRKSGQAKRAKEAIEEKIASLEILVEAFDILHDVYCDVGAYENPKRVLTEKTRQRINDFFGHDDSE